MTLIDAQNLEIKASKNFRLAIDDDPEFVLSAMRCNDGNGTLSYLFFSEEFVDVARAKAICARCSSKAECLAGALGRSEPWGVWGGELIEEGRIRTTKKPRGRPVTKSQAVLTITEVPLPEHWVA
jgi:WhiB family redox-sensing transcriptional regulator